jgi:hypothetical protein
VECIQIQFQHPYQWTKTIYNEVFVEEKDFDKFLLQCKKSIPNYKEVLHNKFRDFVKHVNQRNIILGAYYHEHIPKLKIKDMYKIYCKQKERCMYTENLLVRAKGELFVIGIERMNNLLPYIVGNIAFILTAFNAADCSGGPKFSWTR